jgi:hypothetical protein
VKRLRSYKLGTDEEARYYTLLLTAEDHVARVEASDDQAAPGTASEVSTEGFTGADLKRLAEDGKGIYAHDKAKRLEPKSPTEYFLQAVEGVRQNKQRFAEAEAQLLSNRKG